MPHIVAEGATEYLGIRFVGGPSIQPGETGRFSFVEYFSDVDYSALRAGVKVTVREGAATVAHGVIVEKVLNIRVAIDDAQNESG